MSAPLVYITSAIHGTSPFSVTPAALRAQLTQFTNFSLRVPRKGHRSCDFKLALQSPELAPLYGGIGFRPYMNFVYVSWRGHIVYWGPIVVKEIDFEDNSISIQSMDLAARLEHHYFRIGDAALDDPDDPTVGTLPVSASGLSLALQAGSVPGTGFIPLGIRLGSNNHTSFGTQMKIERGQEIWRTIMDMGDRNDGPLVDIVPLPISDGRDFAVMNVYGQFRNDVSSSVKFHYRTGLNNLRNLKITEGGKVLSHAHVLTQDNHWRTTTMSGDSGNKYGVWIQWEQVDFNLPDGSSESDATASLGAVGDAILDAYGRPLTTTEIVLRRDDEIGATSQFHWLEDFNVSDIVEVQGAMGGESLNGKYQIDEFRLEQESDNSGEVKQAVDIIPWVQAGDFPYSHGSGYIDTEDENA
jgi:hypothetical protein